MQNRMRGRLRFVYSNKIVHPHRIECLNQQQYQPVQHKTNGNTKQKYNCETPSEWERKQQKKNTSPIQVGDYVEVLSEQKGKSG